MMCGDRQARYLATFHGADRTDYCMDFLPLCRRCHHRYDDIYAARRGKPLSEEVRAKISAAVKAAWESPVNRAKKSAASKAEWESPEFRANMKAAIKEPCPHCGRETQLISLERHIRARDKDATRPPERR